MTNSIHIDLLDTILLGDTLEHLKQLPNSSVNLIISSPPYNIGKEYEAKVSLDKYLAQQTNVLIECSRVLCETGSIFWQVGAFADKGSIVPLDIKFFPILEELGLKPRNRIIWARLHGLHARNKFSCRHETILWFTKSDKYKFKLDDIRVPQKYQNKKSYRGENKGKLSCNPDGKNPGDVWLFQNVKHNHEEQTIHPCQFPEDLVARIMLSTTSKGDIVLDPYMGAGTVAVVAQEYERHYIGAELEANYHATALSRIAGVPDENGLFPNLKTLRSYIARTGEPLENFRFERQKGKLASTKSKIFSEKHHLSAFEERLQHEEAVFAAKLRSEELPIDPNLNGGSKKRVPT